MKNNRNQISSSCNQKYSQLQLKKNNTNTEIDDRFISPQKRNSSRIFVQTPQAVYIPISFNQQEMFSHQGIIMSPKNQQKKNKKVNIFDQNLIEPTKQNRQMSAISIVNFQKQIELSSNVIRSKASISLKKQRISEFFYCQNFIICKGLRKVIVYNFLNKSLAEIPVNYDEFILTPFPPYVFNCITGQYLNLYSEDSVQKYAQIKRKRENLFKKKRTFVEFQVQNQNLLQDFKGEENNQFPGGIEITVMKISKLQVECLCRHNQTIYMGGYNRSVLPGGRRSQRREVYVMDHLDSKINNKPKQVIKIEPSSFPVSSLEVQMPYLIVYCRPKFYLFGLKSRDLLLTFQKELKMSMLLEGRYALNVINGVGISNRNSRSTIFTFDVQSSPIYGVQITEHKQEATCVCLQKTGRIFGCYKSALFEYILTKRITRCVKLYSESDTILRIESTPSNSLLVLRQSQDLQYFIEAFIIDENTITDF